MSNDTDRINRLFEESGRVDGEAFAEAYLHMRKQDKRIEELEAINADHQDTVAALQADKAHLIRELTKAQAKGREATQRYCVHGVPENEALLQHRTESHWMHRTGGK